METNPSVSHFKRGRGVTVLVLEVEVKVAVVERGRCYESMMVVV